jgi:hypothetical protein
MSEENPKDPRPDNPTPAGDPVAAKGATQQTAAQETATQEMEFERHLQHRTQFRALLLANPNYFGNLKVSPFQPVVSIQANTTFEDIGCVGFQPQFNRLEAVVYVKQAGGYGGDVCSAGTTEYVRFFLSFDNGATWDDLGLSSFTAYNIPGTSPQNRLEYAVTRPITPPKKFCFVNNIALVRAILSWNVPPPPGDPDYIPIWGDVHNTHIQIDPLKIFLVADILKAAKVQLPAQLANVVDVSQEVPAAEPKKLSAVELKKLYEGKGVELHRFALAEVQKLIETPTLSESLQSAGFKGQLANLDIDIDDITAFFPTDGSTRYEELECIGFDPNQEVLVGVIRVKLPSGFSGGPCTAGSKEFVTFWADLNNNGIFETCLGTTSVNVYDSSNIPGGGLEYAVFLPVNFNSLKQPCQQGPRLIRIRAILSWNVPPPCANPNYIPVWGNREETLIHLKPGFSQPPNVHTPIIQTVGSMDVGDISFATGLANGPAVLAGFTATDSPFGGEVILTGHLANPTDISNGAPPLKYRVEVLEQGTATWQPVANNFPLHRDQLLGGVWSDLPVITQSVDADGYYTYQEDLIGNGGNARIFPVGNVLARWKTNGLTGWWFIRILAKEAASPVPQWFSNVVRVRIDSQAPAVDVAITSGGGSCADFTIGDTISGTYSATDEHFSQLRFMVLPPTINGNPSGGQFTSPAPYPGLALMPLVRGYNPSAPPGVPGSGEAGTWSLDTTGMKKCGYVIELGVWDRTIVDSGGVGRFNRALVGLCLRSPEEG